MQHVGNFAPKDPDMLFVVGDLVQWGSHFDEWDSMWWEPLQVDNFSSTNTDPNLARGNHDVDHPYSYAYVDLPGDGSAYSFTYGDVWILVLNSHAFLFPSNDPLTGQYGFMEDEFQSPAAECSISIGCLSSSPHSNSSTSSTPDQIHGNRGLSTGYPCLRNMMWIP